MKKLLLIMNPNAGTRQGRKLLPEIVSLFRDYGYLTTVCITERRGDAVDFAREFGGHMDIVCCAGGDGTLNETITGMISGGHRTPLGYLPCGSTNDFANGLGISGDLLTAAKNVVAGHPIPLDVGSFNHHYFSYTASFGAFTKVSWATPQNVKNVLGHLAYILEGIKSLPEIHPIPVTVKAENDEGVEERRGEYLFGAVCNSTSLGGLLKLDPGQVDMDDGLFEILLVRNPVTPADFSHLVYAVTNNVYDDPMLDFVRARRATFVFENDVPDWTLDGEYGPASDEVRVENLHNAITLMVPEGVGHVRLTE